MHAAAAVLDQINDEISTMVGSGLELLTHRDLALLKPCKGFSFFLKEQ